MSRKGTSSFLNKRSGTSWTYQNPRSTFLKRTVSGSTAHPWSLGPDDNTVFSYSSHFQEYLWARPCRTQGYVTSLIFHTRTFDFRFGYAEPWALVRWQKKLMKVWPCWALPFSETTRNTCDETFVCWQQELCAFLTPGLLEIKTPTKRNKNYPEKAP